MPRSNPIKPDIVNRGKATSPEDDHASAIENAAEGMETNGKTGSRMRGEAEEALSWADVSMQRKRQRMRYWHSP